MGTAIDCAKNFTAKCELPVKGESSKFLKLLEELVNSEFYTSLNHKKVVVPRSRH